MTKKGSTQLLGKTIIGVTRNSLCTGCGTCAGVCPQNAIAMIVDTRKGIYRPDLNIEKCNYCGLCLTCCPGHGVDFQELNLAIFGTKPDGNLLGNVISCYVGYAADSEIRYMSASGGLVTSLLIFALKQRIIDGALVTKMDEVNPLRPRSFIARTEQEIISAAGSKYCPVPANVAIKELMTSEGRYAVVGLPCHIHGLRKAEQVSKELRQRIVLHFGLVCNHTPSFRATEYLLRKLNRSKKRIVSIRYRGTGWPGGLSIQCEDGHNEFMKYSDLNYWGFAFQEFFWPRRCLVCDDKICELADISFMDAWLPEFKDDKVGHSLFVTRSHFAEQLIRQAIDKQVIFARHIDCQKVCDSQALASVQKKSATRRKLFEMLHRSIPKYHGHQKKEVSVYDVIGELLIFVVRYMGEHWFPFINALGIAWKSACRIERILAKSQDNWTGRSKNQA